MTSPLPADEFEQRAASQRQRLHDSVSELRSSVRERLDPRKAARSYAWQASAVAGLVAFALGYAVGGAFSD
jgi:hypothetical protein